MIRLPYRGNRLLDQRSRFSPAFGAAGEKVPETGAEICTREQRVQGDRDEDHRRARIGQRHASSPSSLGSGARMSRRRTITVNTAMTA